MSDGTLKIVAKRESYSYNGTNKQFTSARLNSKFDMKYGRIDVRAKLPSKGGTWPAIWTLGTNINELVTITVAQMVMLVGRGAEKLILWSNADITNMKF